MSEPPKQRHLARSAGAVSIATMISRVLGLMREMVLAKYFPVVATDAYFAAFRIPNLMRDLFAEGALNGAFVPTLTDTKQNQGSQAAWRLANLVLNVLTVVLSLLTLVILFGAKYLVFLLVSGYAPEKMQLTVQLTRIMAPFLMFVALSAAVMGMLNTHGRFFVPAVASAFFNLASILCGIFLAPVMPRFGQQPIVAMAIGSLLGGAAQLYWQLPSLYRCGFKYQRVFDWKDPGVRRISGLMLPAVFGLAATQINILIDNQLASYLGDGPVSWLNYAFRLMQLPIGLFGVAIATVNLASVSKKVASNDMEGVRSNIAEAMKLSAFLDIPSAIGLMFLRYPIVQLLYERGKFTPQATIHTGDALLFYSLGISAYSLVKILTPTFYALGDTKTPVRFAALVIGVKLAMNLFFIRYLGFLGLALGTTIASTLNTTLLYYTLTKRIGSLKGYGIGKAYLKVITSALFMGISASLIHRFVFFGDLFADRLLRLGISMAGGLVAFVLCSFLLKVEQAHEFGRFLRNRWKLYT